MELSVLGNAVGVITFDSILNSDSEESLYEIFEYSLKQGMKKIILHFSQLDHMNSGGAGVLVKLVELSRQQRIKLFS